MEIRLTMFTIHLFKILKTTFSKKTVVLSILSFLIMILFWSVSNPIEAKNASTVLTKPLLIADSSQKVVNKPLTTPSIKMVSNVTSSSTEQTKESTTNVINNLQFLPEDIKKIAQKGKLVVAVRNVETPPFIMIKEGCKNLKDNEVCVDHNGQKRTFYGLDIKIAKGIVTALNGGLQKLTGQENAIKIELNTSQSKFDEIVKQVVTKQADIVISKLSVSPERGVMINFSDPYLTMDFGLLVNRKRLETSQYLSKMDKIQFLKKLPSKKIGVLEGSFSGRLAENLFPEAETQEFSDNQDKGSAWENAIKAVKKDNKNEPIAAFRDELAIKLEVFRNPNSAIYLETVLFTDIKDLISIGIAADKPQLKSVINEYLKRERHNYTVDDLICRYPQSFNLEQDDHYLEKNCNVQLN